MINLLSVPNRNVLARVYYGAVSIFLLYRLYTHILLSQIENPVLNFVNTDYTYIAFYFSGLSQFLVQHHLPALAFDLSLFAITIAAFIFPSNKYLPIIFTLLLG